VIISYQDYQKIKVKTLKGRYITQGHIAPEIDRLSSSFVITTIGRSVNQKPIYSIKFGIGKIRLLLWSQMHGNESTTTKAVFDFMNFIQGNEFFRNHFQICIIPILNPDGAETYSRLNANQVDLNRDAKLKSQPETLVLFKAFEQFDPHYCFNLHGQRTIFAAGNKGRPATLSFLAPAEDQQRSVTATRKKAMSLIGHIYKDLKPELENAMGLYDDTFNDNCTGDTFQSLGVPTVLFEAGHYPGDYQREQTRYFIFNALVSALHHLASNKEDATPIYAQMPLNEKVYFDVLIKNVKLGKPGIVDMGIQFEESLEKGLIKFIPKIKKIDNLKHFRGHQEFDASGEDLEFPKNVVPKVGDEIDFVIIKNERKLIKI